MSKQTKEEDKVMLIARLYAAWMQTPSLRLGQLISNARSLYYTSDEELVRSVEEYVNTLKK